MWFFFYVSLLINTDKQSTSKENPRVKHSKKKKKKKKKKYFSTYQTRSIITVVFVLGLK